MLGTGALMTCGSDDLGGQPPGVLPTSELQTGTQDWAYDVRAHRTPRAGRRPAASPVAAILPMSVLRPHSTPSTTSSTHTVGLSDGAAVRTKPGAAHRVQSSCPLGSTGPPLCIGLDLGDSPVAALVRCGPHRRRPDPPRPAARPPPPRRHRPPPTPP